MIKSRTISIVFVRSILDSSKCKKEDILGLLKNADIPVELLKNDKARVSVTMFTKLCQAVYDRLRDESGGYYPSPLKLGTFSVLVRYMHSGYDLQNAMQLYIEFYKLFDTGFHLTLNEIADDKVAFRMHGDPFLNFPPWVYEQLLMSSHRLFCWLTETHFMLDQVNMNYLTPNYVEEYHYLFGCPVNFNQPHSEIIFDKKYLKLGIIKNYKRLDAYLKRIPYNLLLMPRNDKSYAEKIRRSLRSTLPNIPEYETIAETLNIHPQTLRRRLKSEGCDYRQLRNELIRDTAMSYLRRNELEIKQIAYALGFSEPSAFIRSFKRWTGTTPNQYRKEQLLLSSQKMT